MCSEASFEGVNCVANQEELQICRTLNSFMLRILKQLLTVTYNEEEEVCRISTVIVWKGY